MNKVEDRIPPGFWIGLFVVLLLIGVVNHCKAQSKAKWDTIPCRVEAIDKYVSRTTAKGTEQIFAVYHDTQSGISELISVPKSTYDYIRICKELGVKPNLAIRLRNQEIYSIIRIKKKYRL